VFTGRGEKGKKSGVGNLKNGGCGRGAIRPTRIRRGWPKQEKHGAVFEWGKGWAKKAGAFVGNRTQKTAAM